ncbi:MAG: MltA domain-containing protein [Nitrospirae bacterium]|nr:MltA domain-containing protein [Nitrospirota bacterium]
MRILLKYAVLLAVILASVSCARVAVKQPVPSDKPMVRLAAAQYPQFSDDASIESLKEAVNRNLKYLSALKEDHLFHYGDDTYTPREIKASLLYFMSVLHTCKGDVQMLNKSMREDFTVYAASGSDGLGKVYYTGYYVPVLDGSRTKTGRYRYPLYSLPKDLFSVDADSGKSVGRRVEGKVVPYYTHEEIHKGALAGRGLEFLWVDNRVDLFFLQVQGSGTVRLEDGSMINVTYAGANGRSYKPAGRVLVDENKIPLSEMSLKAIKRYLSDHPEDVDRVLFSNPSYVFFRESRESAIGSTGVSLIDGRAIATDKKVFPQGALVYVSTNKSEFREDESLIGQSQLTRFALNQDTGGAIIGPGRADFFWGRGSAAELQAGYMKYNGTLYFIVKKRK